MATKFDALRHCIVMAGGAVIPVDREYEVEGEIFRELDCDGIEIG